VQREREVHGHGGLADATLARQADVEDKAGSFAGERKYGAKGNVLSAKTKAPSQGQAPSPRPSPQGERERIGTRGNPSVPSHQGASVPVETDGAASVPSPFGGEGQGEGDSTGEGDSLPSRIQREYQPVQPTFAQTSAVPDTRARKPSIDDMGPGTDRPVPARDADAVSRIRKPTLDEMGSHSNRPIPARAPDVDPRAKSGAYGEKVSGPHKPTLDEMGPHAERGLPVAGKPVPPKPPMKTMEIFAPAEKKARRGRPRKTGRPGA